MKSKYTTTYRKTKQPARKYRNQQKNRSYTMTAHSFKPTVVPINKDVSALAVTEIVRNAKISTTSALVEEVSGMSRNQTRVALAHARKLGFIVMIGNVRSAEYCLPGRERAAIEEAKRRQRAAAKARQDRFKAKQKDKPKIGQANRIKEAADGHKRTAADIKSLLNRGPMTKTCIISDTGTSSSFLR